MVMQPYPLLETKLHTPVFRPEGVMRPRLLERLDAGWGWNGGAGCKLTLISAPAGFGKTTLLAEWVHRLSEAGTADGIAWLSLDEDDNDLARFLVYVVATLSKIEARIGKGVLNQLRTSPPPTEEILTFLINILATLPGRIVLVLDDYHLIEDQAIHDALAFLLARLPRQVHLVISTREDPYLPLARLRARGELTELRASDLRFTSSEAAEFLNQVMGLALSAEDIAALEARTEGWIAGLQLAALALQGTSSVRGQQGVPGFVQSFTGSHRFVLDYLVEEVLDRQPEKIQTFLLQTAILDRLTAPLCDAVRSGSPELPAGQEDGQATLERLDRANLFIVPLDDERRWYRYHHLFADLLQKRLQKTYPEEIPNLHRRASEWYEQNDLFDEAIEHALRAGDQARAVSLMEVHADAAWRRGEHAKLRHWLQALPLEAIRAKPRLCLYHTWYLFAGGRQEEAEEALQACEEAMDAHPDLVTGTTTLAHRGLLSDLDRQTMRGRAAVLRAFIATYIGDVAAIIRHARRALDLLPEQDLTWRRDAALALGDAQGFRGDLASAYAARLEAAEASQVAGETIFSLLAHLKVAITLREQGRLQRTIELCQEQLEFASRSGLMHASVPGGFQAIWGEVLAELGDLEGALDLVTKGMEAAERGGESLVTGWGYLCLARVHYSRGDMAGVIAVARKLERNAQDTQIPPWIWAEVAAWKARAWLAQGKLAAASRWARQRGLIAGGQPKEVDAFDFFSLNAFLVLARILLARERWDEALGLLLRLLEAAEAGERTSKAIEILGLQAMAAQAKGDTSLALGAIENALTLAVPEGFVQTFVDEGPPMAHLLYQALGRGMEPEYVSRLLAAFPVAEPEPAAPPGSQPQESDLIEPLSERELEVLQLIAEGLTNREIAARLFVSLNTVKGHTRSIYGKLAVHSRTQAIARATALGLLSSP
jgi:LuxR family transcriptional regulator, maltose regulon positive regulatory protein